MIGPSEASLAPLVAGAGASEENASAETRLLDAAAAGSPELVHQLLTSRVSVQHADALGWTSIHHLATSSASPADKCSTLSALRRAGADVDHRAATSGLTALHIAARRFDDVGFIEALLLASRSSASARDRDGRTPLHHLALAAAPSPADSAPHSLRAAQGDTEPPPPPPRAPPKTRPATGPLQQQEAAARVLCWEVDPTDSDAQGMSAADLAASLGALELAELLRRYEETWQRRRRSCVRQWLQPFVLLLAVLLAHAAAVISTPMHVASGARCALLPLLFLPFALSLGIATACSDPGYLPRVYLPRVVSPLDAGTAGGSGSGGRTSGAHGGASAFCFACRIAKPIRARHCRACERCVSGFDHHCPWIRNCIGEGNRGLFYLWVSVMWLDAAALTLSAALTLAASPESIPRCHARQQGQCTLLEERLRRPTLLTLASAAGLFCVCLGRFWAHRTRNALVNLTTSERHSRRHLAHFHGTDGGYVNPFDRGALKNCTHFFCAGRARSHRGDGLLLEPGRDSGPSQPPASSE